MGEINKGVNNPNFGKTHSEETNLKMSLAVSGENNPEYGETHTDLAKSKLSVARGTTIFVYDKESSLVNSFNSARKAGEHFNNSHSIIVRYTKNEKILSKTVVFIFSQ